MVTAPSSLLLPLSVLLLFSFYSLSQKGERHLTSGDHRVETGVGCSTGKDRCRFVPWSSQLALVHQTVYAHFNIIAGAGDTFFISSTATSPPPPLFLVPAVLTNRLTLSLSANWCLSVLPPSPVAVDVARLWAGVECEGEGKNSTFLPPPSLLPPSSPPSPVEHMRLRVLLLLQRRRRREEEEGGGGGGGRKGMDEEELVVRSGQNFAFFLKCSITYCTR